MAKLRVNKEGTLTSTIIDVEIDPIKCTFNNDDSVELKTDGYSYVTLSTENLFELIRLIDLAEKRYEKLNK